MGSLELPRLPSIGSAEGAGSKRGHRGDTAAAGPCARSGRGRRNAHGFSFQAPEERGMARGRAGGEAWGLPSTGSLRARRLRGGAGVEAHRICKRRDRRHSPSFNDAREGRLGLRRGVVKAAPGAPRARIAAADRRREARRDF